MLGVGDADYAAIPLLVLAGVALAGVDLVGAVDLANASVRAILNHKLASTIQTLRDRVRRLSGGRVRRLLIDLPTDLKSCDATLD